MATLIDLIESMCRYAEENETSLTKSFCAGLSRHIRSEYGGDKIFIPILESRKDPARREQIKRLASQLPTGVVASRVGVHPSWVRKVVKK